MKTKLINSIKITAIVFATMLFGYACEEGTKLVDVDYPESLIYIPASVTGIYTIEELNEDQLSFVSGTTHKFVADKDNNQFIIPLSAYRSGVDVGKKIAINIAVKNEKIEEIVLDEDLLEAAQILPADKYSIENSVNMQAGERVAPFNLVADFKFLYDNSFRNNDPPQKYLLAINIESPDCKSNPNLSTVVILIDTKIMVPVPKFEGVADKKEKTKVTFSNISEYATGYLWDFGDTTPTSTEKEPVHNYAVPGTYNVTLTATGIYGNTVSSTVELTVY